MAAALLLGAFGPVKAASLPQANSSSILPAPAPNVTALPPVGNSDKHFGIVQAFENTGLAVNAGASWERVPFFWNLVQPNGPTDWNPDQFLINSAQLANQAANHLEVVGQIGNPPAWAVKDGSTPKNLNLAWNDPNNYWGQFVYKLAQTYAGRVDTWIIWNEPDYPKGNPLSTWAGTEQDYYLLLKDAYQAAKAANPNAKIVFAGTTYWVDVNVGKTLFFQRVLEAARTMDGANAQANGYYFDVVDVHLYSSPLDLYRVPQAYKQVLANFGLTKPIWITESNVAPYDDPGNETAAGSFRASLSEQANFVIRAFAMALAAGVERISLYKLVDGTVADKMPWGMSRDDGSLRPEYVAYQVAVQHFSGTGTMSYSNGGGVDFVTFDRGDSKTWMLVNTLPNATTVTIPWLAPTANITTKNGVTTAQNFPGIVNGQAPQLSISLAGATNGIIGGDPVIVDQKNIGGSFDIGPEQIFFPIVGHGVANGILDYWRSKGGLKYFGQPASDELKQPDGRIVQFFDKGTIEVFPQFAGTPFYFQEGTGKASPTDAVAASKAGGAQFFKETGHNVAFAFLNAYKALGGLDTLGLPRTEAITYKGQTVQFFQRAVMDYHPEAAGTPGEVTLELLGSNVTQGR
ncbi:MAG TPA: glycosyl hydrolase, partial [Chloroflexota bacterium]|nr:glycosyl hydrolase [Chloroflexota bacterium]